MEQFIRDYLRILDIDPYGCFIRLINISHDQSIDLSNILVRQWRHDMQMDEDLTVASYAFTDQIRPLLRSGEVVSIYSKSSHQFEFDVVPYIFIAENIRRWFIDDDIQTEIVFNEAVCQSDRFYSFPSDDIPTLFLNRPIDSERFPTKPIPYTNRYARPSFPYCLSSDDIVNPHTSARIDREENQSERNACYEKNQTVKDFNSYPRRLTTASLQIPSATMTSRRSSGGKEQEDNATFHLLNNNPRA